MGCPKGQTISAYIDGALIPSKANEVRMHMDTCKVCASVAAELAATRDMIKAQPSLSAPEGFLGRTHCRLNRRERHPVRPVAWPKTAFLGAAVLGIALIGISSWLWISDRRQSDPLIAQCLQQYVQAAEKEPMEPPGCVSPWDAVLGGEIP